MTSAQRCAFAQAADGSYAGNLDLSGPAPGAYTVYVRACFGDNNCGFGTRNLTL